MLVIPDAANATPEDMEAAAHAGIAAEKVRLYK